MPDIGLEYSYGENSIIPGNVGIFQVGLKIPLLFGTQKSKVKASKINQDIVTQNTTNYKFQLESKQQQLQLQINKYNAALSYYETEGKDLSEAILKTANISFKNGEIDFFQYIQSIENSYQITLSYLKNLNQYNQTVIQLNNLIL